MFVETCRLCRLPPAKPQPDRTMLFQGPGPKSPSPIRRWVDSKSQEEVAQGTSEARQLFLSPEVNNV